MQMPFSSSPSQSGLDGLVQMGMNPSLAQAVFDITQRGGIQTQADQLVMAMASSQVHGIPIEQVLAEMNQAASHLGSHSFAQQEAPIDSFALVETAIDLHMNQCANDQQFYALIGLLEQKIDVARSRT